MHPAYINKVTDDMIQAAQTPGQGMTPGNSGANTGMQESGRGSQPPNFNYAGFVPVNQGIGYVGGFNL